MPTEQMEACVNTCGPQIEVIYPATCYCNKLYNKVYKWELYCTLLDSLFYSKYCEKWKMRATMPTFTPPYTQQVANYRGRFVGLSVWGSNKNGRTQPPSSVIRKRASGAVWRADKHFIWSILRPLKVHLTHWCVKCSYIWTLNCSLPQPRLFLLPAEESEWAFRTVFVCFSVEKL